MTPDPRPKAVYTIPRKEAERLQITDAIADLIMAVMLWVYVSVTNYPRDENGHVIKSQLPQRTYPPVRWWTIIKTAIIIVCIAITFYQLLTD
jgi:heme/copper-type cytochrome/quinol oxidase subunit 2